MARRILPRLLSMILTLVGVSLVVYVAITFLPGNRAQLIMGDGVAESSYQSLHTQETGYFEWLWRILHLDFGHSSFGGQDVASLVAGRIPASLQLALLSIIVALAISTCVVGLSLLYRNAFTTFLYEGLSLASLSLPSFIVALSMILVFSVSLGLLPSGGYVRFTRSPMDCIASLAMPAVCLGFIHSGLLMRMMHSSLERELRRSYVTLARAKGLGEGRVIGIHAGVNILGEMTTLTAQSLVTIFSSSAALEYVFSIPGLGALAVTAIARRDMPTLAAIVMLAAFLSLVTSFICDCVNEAGRGGET